MRATDVNKLQEAKRTGEPILGMSLLTMDSPDLVETLGHAGIEYLFFDREQQPIGWEALSNAIRACELYGIFPVVRINKEYPGYPTEIRKAYAIGAGMVQIPHINTKEEAIAVVRGAKFGPDYEYGPWPADQVRGLAPMSRAGNTRMAANSREWCRMENEKRMVTVMLEEKKAVENAEEIMSVEGIDNVVMGLGDLSFDMAIPGARVRPGDHPKYKKLIDKVQNLRKKFPGKFIENRSLNWLEVLTNPEKAKKQIKQGIKEGAYLFNIAPDKFILREVVKRCKEAIKSAYNEVKEEK